MEIFKDLKPESIWRYFYDILQIPRPSKKEEKITKYLMNFAKKHNLEAITDKVGNVLIKKPASKGNENKKSVVLQSHIDMVCEKNSDIDFNFEKDPIQAYVEDGWVKAKGTTLGADDGIGVAAQLAILESKTIEHGPLECLFTADEETGMSGAFGLEEGIIKSEILINLDSEDEGELFIGCAGGIDTVAKISYKPKKSEKKHIAFQIKVTGLKGGHSGDDIHKELGNSNIILNRFLWNLNNKIDYHLSVFDGGNLRNAIAREAFAQITIKPKDEKKLTKYFNKFVNEVSDEIKIQEPELKIECKSIKLPKSVVNNKAKYKLINAIYACPHGVHAWSMEMPGLVETSTNLASVKFVKKNTIEIVTSQRSSVNSAKQDIAAKVASVFNLADAKVAHTGDYPGWKPNTDSEILKITNESYKKLFKKEPIVRAIHAGLECGLFLTKYPKLDMISFGPTIRGAHSPDEKLDIETVTKFWDHLLDVLKNIPAKS